MVSSVAYDVFTLATEGCSSIVHLRLVLFHLLVTKHRHRLRVLSVLLTKGLAMDTLLLTLSLEVKVGHAGVQRFEALLLEGLLVAVVDAATSLLL